MNKIKLLIADDHITFVEGLQRVLADENDIDVIGVAYDGEGAVKLAAELKPNVVIMDIAMPVLNGIAATRQIKEVLPNTAVLILSAYDYVPYVLSSVEAGAAGYLLKNIRLKELVNSIRGLYSGENVFDRGVAERVLRNLARSWRGVEESSSRIHHRELEVLRLGAKGLSNNEIAQKLNISPRTVQTHFSHIFTKLGVGSRVEAILHCLREGWLILDDLP